MFSQKGLFLCYTHTNPTNRYNSIFFHFANNAKKSFLSEISFDCLAFLLSLLPPLSLSRFLSFSVSLFSYVPYIFHRHCYVFSILSGNDRFNLRVFLKYFFFNFYFEDVGYKQFFCLAAVLFFYVFHMNIFSSSSSLYIIYINSVFQGHFTDNNRTVCSSYIDVHIVCIE